MRLPKYSKKPKKPSLLFVRKVVGGSMLPVLRPGQIIIASSLFTRLKPELVVVVRHNGVDKIKRINKIHHGQIFVIGDNPRASTDSRSFGWLPANTVVGKVFWPRV